MRVVIDACCFGRQKTGNEVYLRGLLYGLRQLIREQSPEVQNLAFTLLTTDRHQGARASEFDWVDIPLGNFATRNFLTIPRHLQALRADLYHATYWTGLSIRTPFVVTIHDLSFVALPQAFRWHEGLVYRTLVRRSARDARRILTVSEFSKSELQRHWNVDAPRIVVAPNGLSEELEKILDGPEQEPETSDEEPPYLLYVGNLHPRKNLVRLLHAYQQLKRDRPDQTPRLKIVGQKAWLYEDIFREFRDSRFRDAIEFTGYLPGEKLRSLFRRATLTVYPSLYEGFGLPVLEAMACGSPVVTSSTTALAEVAGDAAILVDPQSEEAIARGIQRVLDSSELQNRLRQAGKKRADQFRWRASARLIAQAYQEALNPAPPEARTP